MHSIIRPQMVLLASLFVLVGFLTSSNIWLWIASLLTLPVAIWLLGGRHTLGVLLWVIGINWLQVVGDVASAELAGRTVGEDWIGHYRTHAIFLALCAILALALGMRFGTKLGDWTFRAAAQGSRLFGPDEGVQSVNLRRAVIGYVCSFFISQALGVVAGALPSLAQPILAFSLIKFAFVYLVAATVFQTQRGYPWLVLVFLVEMGTGMVSFFATYKEAFIVIMIAFVSRRRVPNAKFLAFALAGTAAVIWVSLVWTEIKMEYRHQVFSKSLEEQVKWLAQKYLVGDIDYGGAITKLVNRIGYTELYAQVLERRDFGAIPGDFNFYGSAVLHVLTPRAVFVDKAALDDSAQTMALLGLRIDEGTSIGVGIVAQAHIDFGFPGMFVPLAMLGVLIGWIARYFMTRAAPLIICQAFVTACLFNPVQISSNIDKVLGALITGCIGMALVLKFCYPIVARWLETTHTHSRQFPRGAPGGWGA